MAWNMRASPAWWGIRASAEEMAAAARAAHWRLRAWREPRVVAGPASAARLGAAGLLLPLTVAIAFLLEGVLSAPAVVGQYLAFDRRTQAIEIVDARERWLGVVPAAMEPAVASDLAGWPEHRTLAVDLVPRGWLDVLVALEDRHAGSWRHWCGIDAVALARAAVFGALGQSGRGGSTLAMQLVRSMRHLSPGSDPSLLARLKRKVLEIRHGAMLACTLGGVGDQRFQRLLARHLPLVQGTPDSRMGGVLYGLGMAARVLFDKPLEALDLAEQAVLAAAVRRHILLAPDGDTSGIALLRARWEEVTARAGLGLRLAYGGKSPRVIAALDRLVALPLPHPELSADIAWATEADAAERFRLAANPEYRAAALIKGEMVTALGEMWLRFGEDYRGRVVGLSLTLDVAENLVFKRRLERTLAVTEARLGDRLALPLLARGASDRIAQVVLMEANAAGRIHRHYLNAGEPVSLGLGWRRAGTGSMALVPTERHVGSVAKAALAVLLGTQDGTGARYCNVRTADGRIHNWDGDAGVAACDEPGAWHGVGDVFGRSLNLPLLSRLRGVPASDLVELARQAGLRLDPGTPPATAMVLGMASTGPMRLLALMQAIANGVMGRPGVAVQPRIVAGYRLRGDDGGVDSVGVPEEVVSDLQRYFAIAGTAGFVRHVLGAPLKSGGTLSALAGKGAGDMAVHLAKTGTTTVDGGIRDKWVIGVRETAGDLRSYALLVGTAEPTQPLGQHISGNQLAEVIQELWR